MRRRTLRNILLGFIATVAAILGLVALTIYIISEGFGGRLEGRGAVSPVARTLSSDAETAAVSQGLPQGPATEASSQILFGDLHVHTSWSGDAFIFSLPLLQGEGAHPPADACDFARHCAGLDFWSINDHAEYITPRQWRETKQAIRDCNEVAGDPSHPDLVSFLGWEWTQSAAPGTDRPEEHFGHKNVLFRDTAEDSVPTRPIGAGRGGLFSMDVPAPAWSLVRAGLAIRDLNRLQPYLDFNAFAREVRQMDYCADDVPVRELPVECMEGAETPGQLFDKLDDWGYPSLVIPHGTTWGIHAPPGASLATQLDAENHDPARQRLFEVYSGHGNSHLWRAMNDTVMGPEGEAICAPPTEDYRPCCWQAGELIRARCEADLSASECEARVESARQAVVDTGNPYGVVAGSTPSDWLECGQLQNTFLPAFEYRPQMSAQYGLALRAEDGSTYRYGLIGSSDNHKGRPGPGYKETARKAFGDAYGLRDDWYQALQPDASPVAEPQIAPDPLAGLMTGFERGASFYYTSGLVAVHSENRTREAIWEALNERRAYATSGPRILLFFDLLNGPDETPAPMGAHLKLDQTPRFRARAVGSFRQKPGCPEHAEIGLGPERLERLCLGECYHPSDERHRIERIEVIRIRKQRDPSEDAAPLIEDPWKVLTCEDVGQGCLVEFEGTPPEPNRETLYYIRALQEPTDAVNGDPLQCERDGQGRCLTAPGCPASGPDFDPTDDCLAPVQERAWSSPIFIESA